MKMMVIPGYLSTLFHDSEGDDDNDDGDDDEDDDDNNNNNNNNSILYYLCAESTAVRPITDTAQCTYK
jgi:hypothetical protein